MIGVSVVPGRECGLMDPQEIGEFSGRRAVLAIADAARDQIDRLRIGDGTQGARCTTSS